MHIGLFDPDWRGHHTPYVDLLSRYFISEGHRATFVTDERHDRLNELPETENLSVVTKPFWGDPQAPPNFLRSVQDQFFQTCQLRTTLRIAEARSFDVLHLLYFDRLQIPLRLAALSTIPDIPVVATLHRDAFVTAKDDDLSAQVISAITTRALDTTLRNKTLDVLTVHADDIRDRIIDSVPSATLSTVQTVPAPTPKPDATSNTEQFREELDLPTARDIVLFFGSLRNEKGPDILADQLRGLNRPLTVVFAGSPSDFSEGDIEMWRRSTGDNIHILARLEYVPEDEVDKYFAAADVTALPYRRARGISGPLRRSAMIGTPVIGAAETDIGRIIDRHGLGATFDSDDRETFVEALDQTLNAGSELRSALEVFASSRHWETTGEVLIDIYEEVLRE